MLVIHSFTGNEKAPYMVKKPYKVLFRVPDESTFYKGEAPKAPGSWKC